MIGHNFLLEKIDLSPAEERPLSDVKILFTLERRAALPRSSVKGQLVCGSSDPVYPEPVTFQSYTIHNKLTAT